MSQENTIQEQGFSAQLSVCGHTFQLITTGQSFDGIIDPLPPVDPRMDLGSDIREISSLQVLREDCPVIAQGDRLTQTSVSPQAAWRVVKLEDNPSDPVNKMWVVKVTESDQ
jgi:hypothetical protein